MSGWHPTCRTYPQVPRMLSRKTLSNSLLKRFQKLALAPDYAKPRQERAKQIKPERVCVFSIFQAASSFALVQLLLRSPPRMYFEPWRMVLETLFCSHLMALAV